MADWHYGFGQDGGPGPFLVFRNPGQGPDGSWQKGGVDVPTSATGQTSFHPFEITAAEAPLIGAPAGSYLMVKYTTDPDTDMDAFGGTQILTIGQGQILYPEKEQLVEQIMDTVNVGDATAAIDGQVTAFNKAVDEYNTDHGTSHPHLDVTGDLDWVNDLVADLPMVFGYRLAFFSASFGFSPTLFTKDYVEPTP